MTWLCGRLDTPSLTTKAVAEIGYRQRMLQDMREEEARLRREFAVLSATLSERSVASEQSEATQLILLKESLQHQNGLLRERMAVQTQLVRQFRRAFTAGRQVRALPRVGGCLRTL